jgi:hypothetical protein
MRNNQSDIKLNVSRGFQNRLHNLRLWGHVIHNYAGDVRKLGYVEQCAVPLHERLKTIEERHATEIVIAVLTLMCARERWVLTNLMSITNIAG